MMMTRLRGPASVAWALLIVLMTLLATNAGAAEGPDGGVVRATALTDNQTYVVPYRAWNGLVRSATVLLPADYAPGSGEALPCIIQPHARHSSPAYTATIWRGLPTSRHFMVICPDSVGRKNAVNAWGVQGQIADIMDMPDVVEASIPWVRIDRERLYLAGVSMGGQEALDTLTRFPDRFAAAVVYDGVSDLAARYYELARIGRYADQRAMRVEVGGTPKTVSFRYRIRSAKPFGETLARCRVPLAITWSTADGMVINQAKTQTGALCRQIRSFDPYATLTETVTALSHGVALRSDPQKALDFLCPGGEWRTRQGAPATWSYGSWLAEAEVWGWQFSQAQQVSKLWQVTVAPGSVQMHSRVAIDVAMPWGGTEPVQLSLNGGAIWLTPEQGSLTVPFPAGDSQLLFTPAA